MVSLKLLVKKSAFNTMIFFTVIIFCTACKEEKEESVIKYLKEQYKIDFIINEEIDNIDDDVISEYSVSPEFELDFKFTVKKIYTSSNIFPFLPSIKHKSYNDNLIEDLKIYISSQIDSSKLSVKKLDDIVNVSNEIYDIMLNINSELEKYSISTTKYSCSICLNITIKNVEKNIEFYILDINKIEETLSIEFNN